MSVAVRMSQLCGREKLVIRKENSRKEVAERNIL